MCVRALVDVEQERPLCVSLQGASAQCSAEGTEESFLALMEALNYSDPTYTCTDVSGAATYEMLMSPKQVRHMCECMQCKGALHEGQGMMLTRFGRASATDASSTCSCGNRRVCLCLCAGIRCVVIHHSRGDWSMGVWHAWLPMRRLRQCGRRDQ